MIRVSFNPGAAACLLLTSAGCAGPQSALQPAGKGAAAIAELFWVMLLSGAVIWLLVMGLAIYSVRTSVDAAGSRRVRAFIIGGGTIVPTILLSCLLVVSLPLLPELLTPPPDDALQIEVRGKMWWWRVRYTGANDVSGKPVELANEIRLPVGEAVDLSLASDDVIHSFWVPSLGGKVDMIPGRRTRLKLEPTKTGIFRGACAEYCGASHAWMNFDVIVMEREAFASWLQQQRQNAEPPVDAEAARGQELFFRTGCHACHAIRGTRADGVVGPDLTHVGSRHSLAAAALANQHPELVRWISEPASVKPGVKMPPFEMLDADEVQAIATYLQGLQ